WRESMKKHFGHAVRNLVAAVLKEKGSNGQLTQSSTHALWEQCCSDSAVVSSACCDALVLMVDQEHADLHYILKSVLNILPSARTCPHPFITALENRVDCWSALLLHIDDFIQQAVERQAQLQHTMLVPFLRYLYCEPQRQPQHALLRHSLLRVLLPIHTQDTDFLNGSYKVESSLGIQFRLYCAMTLCLQHLEAVLELCGFVDALLPHLLRVTGDGWRTQKVQLLLWLLCICQRCLKFNGDCRPVLHLMQQLLPACQQVTVSYATTITPSSPLQLSLSSWYSELSTALSILHKVVHHPSAAADWLLAVGSTLTSSQKLPCCLTLIVTHLILTAQEDVCQLALKTCQAIAAADPSQVCDEHRIIERLMFHCNYLPIFQLCIPMLLQTLHMLASAPKLKAVAMRLMTILWKRQDRVYTELQCLLSQQNRTAVMGRDTEWEQLLSRAACIRDICRERPYQHGGDMLAAITHILKQCNTPDLAVPATLAMQGLQALCQAEVVDIISTWRSLGPVLSCDSRPMMVKAIADFLALVPELLVNSEEYEVFLFSFQFKDPEVACCGYKALACFPEGLQTVMHLPEARPIAKPCENVEVVESTEDEQEEKDLSIPGSSYVKLLTLTSPPVLPAFGLFLTSLMKQEMSQMPRGVYFSAMRASGLRSDQGKTLAGIPLFMLKTYERNKQPGMKPGLAAGMLLCYELPVQTDREGRAIIRFLVSRSRSYQQTLTALIHEVNIQPSEWHHALFLPPAWKGFMNRAFHAVLQGRRADLEMQQKQHKDMPEELQYKHHCAWLWARDQLTDVIKTATKESPVVQGNSILALSGLAAVVAKYESSLPAENDGSLVAGPEFVPTASWLSMVLDTLLSIISCSHQPRGQVLPWFLHRSYSGENTASAIARSCASMALSLLVPELVLRRKDALDPVLLALQDNLPGSSSADHSQVLQFHSGLALGMVLSNLLHQRLSDVSVLKDSDFLCSCLEILESCSFDPNLEYKSGCILGLGLVLSALCNNGRTDQHNHIIQALDKLLASLQDSSDQGRLLQEVSAYFLACLGLSAFSAGFIDAAKAEEIMNSLRTLTEESQQSPGFSLALGLVVDGLSKSGHGKAEDLHPRLLAAWIKILLAEGCPTMQRLAAVNGLVALVGSERYLIQVMALTSHSLMFTEPTIISFSGAIGLQSNSACLVAHLHLAHVSTRHSYTAVPQDFSYLSEKSIIKAITDFIIEAGKKGPELFHPAVVKTALSPLASVGVSFQYPPINWSTILSPLMRLSFGEDVQHQCVALAVCQAQSSQSASLFLGCWLSLPLVHSLSLQCRRSLYESLGLWMKHVAEDKLQVFLENFGVQLFQGKLQSVHLPLCGSLLQGLARAMALPNPPNSCWTILCSTTEKIFKLLPNTIQDDEVDLYVGIARCLSEMSDTEIDRITHMEKSGFILAYLTSQGRVPLLCLNDLIAGVLQGWPSHRVGWLLLQAFYQCRLAAGSNTGVSKRMEWLLELMGHLRNIVYGTVAVPCNVQKATDFLFQLFAAAVVSWADHCMPLLLGLRAQWFPWQVDTKPPALTHRLFGDELLAEHTLHQCMLGLPCSLPLLLDKEPWCSQTHKFMDWLFSITEGPEQSLSAVTVSTARATLLSLKSSADFKKKAVWTRVYGW
uniref:DUF3730 domain-containing protein n=1 Tax=Gouania willdenowi TaxID=441366 RepID=A0A8C5EA82_GOUWI